MAPGSACCQWGCQHERRHANKKQKEKERKGRRKRTPIDQKSLKNAPVWRRKRRKKRRREKKEDEEEEEVPGGGAQWQMTLEWVGIRQSQIWGKED